MNSQPSTSASSTKRALITGITGQDGSYLADLLIKKGYEVHGIVRRTSNLVRSRIEHLRNDKDVYDKSFFLHYGDLLDMTTIRRIFNKVQPHEVYHLAGQSHVGLSFEIPESTCEEVAMATLRLFEICRDMPEPARIYHASSSEIFGHAEEAPQDEETPFHPVNPYGCAKAFATQTARVFREAYDLFVCNGIAYNHESPRRGQHFVTRKITQQVARIARGESEEIRLGNLEANRDWGHAKDYVRAMWLMLQQERPEDFVLATGRQHSVRDWVNEAFRVAKLNPENHVKIDPQLYRKTEPSKLVGNPEKAEGKLSWRREYSFSELVREMVERDLA